MAKTTLKPSKNSFAQMFSAIFSENFLCLPNTYDSEKDMAKAKAKKKAGAKKKRRLLRRSRPRKPLPQLGLLPRPPREDHPLKQHP
jgi:hypothetical protein